ncbi:hypothetical protein [Nonomuraea dietziae]|uniref:hypothetical protein n=1 Tax=Nonomuraea dietziae TaxID=65515 RepID=UPI003416AED2
MRECCARNQSMAMSVSVTRPISAEAELRLSISSAIVEDVVIADPEAQSVHQVIERVRVVAEPLLWPGWVEGDGHAPVAGVTDVGVAVDVHAEAEGLTAAFGDGAHSAGGHVPRQHGDQRRHLGGLPWDGAAGRLGWGCGNLGVMLWDGAAGRLGWAAETWG